MLASQTPVVAEPTATPKPVPPLDRQLKTAQSISEPLIRDAAYLDIVLQAIILRDYWTAIRVAEATSTTGTQARGLKFVVKCAIEDRQYRDAEEAANRIDATNYHDQARREIIDARGSSTSGSEPLRSGSTSTCQLPPSTGLPD